MSEFGVNSILSCLEPLTKYIGSQGLTYFAKTYKGKKVFVKFYFCKSILSGFLLKRILEISTAWTISWFIEFELHRASKVQVKSHFEFLILLFFEFELCLGAQVFRICALICNFFWLVSKCSFPNIRIIVFKFNSIWYSISETC